MRLPTAVPVDLLEEVQNRALELLYHDLNPTLARIEAARSARDAEMAAILGAGFAATTHEPVVTWQVGDQPANVELPPEAYPVLNVWVHHASSGAALSPDGQGLDDATVAADMIVEFWVKADSATLADRRAKRLAQAIRLVFRQSDRHRTLGGLGRLARVPEDIDLSKAYERKLSPNSAAKIWLMGGRDAYRVEGTEA